MLFVFMIFCKIKPKFRFKNVSPKVYTWLQYAQFVFSLKGK